LSSLFNIVAGSSTEFYNFDVTNSLRFDDGSNTYLNRTPSSAGNRQIWTWSAWVKRTTLGTQQVLFMAGTASTSRTMIYFETDDTLRVYIRESGVNLGRGSGTSIGQVSSSVFRDPSAWYHIVVAFDTTQADASSPLRADANRLKFYVNSVQQTNDTSHTFANSAISQNANTLVNHTVEHAIGHIGYDDSSDFDGYLAEVNLIDGTQLAPTSFGQTKSGVWIAKNTSGLTFGTNGFRLQFKQTGTGTASSSTIGADTSGNTHHYTSNNLSAHDVVPDSPTNNFATFNPLILDDFTLSEGSLYATSAVAQLGVLAGTMSTKGQKFYCEVRVVVVSNGTAIGIAKSSYAGSRAYGTAQDFALYYSFGGTVFKFEVNQGVSWATYTSGDVIGMAIDGVAGTIQFFKNGVSQGTISEATLATEDYLIYCINGTTSGGNYAVYTLNSGQDSTFAGTETVATNTDENGIGAFHHSVPSGFLAMCTANLSEPSITPLHDDIPEDYFNTVLYEGNGTAIGSGGQAVTGVGFQSDWIWIKNRDAADNHAIYDVVRGVTKQIEIDDTSAETTESEGLTAFGANGFTVGSLEQVNTSSESFVSWNWFAGGTPSATNSAGAGNPPTSGSVMINGSASTASLAGTIPATKISANTEAGFSIISYTGTGSASTIAHGLTSAPDIVIVKNLDDGSKEWPTQVALLGNPFLEISTTIGGTTNSAYFNNTIPTSTVFSVGTVGATNASSDNFIAYVFHSVEGYSKIGSYIGNGSADGSFVYTGFRPAFLIAKKTHSSGGNWFIHDSTRSVVNPSNNQLQSDNNLTEYTSGVEIDLLSNGFKLRNASGMNTTTYNYIYLAFAEMPFKYANAR